ADTADASVGPSGAGPRASRGGSAGRAAGTATGSLLDTEAGACVRGAVGAAGPRFGPAGGLLFAFVTAECVAVGRPPEEIAAGTSAGRSSGIRVVRSMSTTSPTGLS